MKVRETFDVTSVLVFYGVFVNWIRVASWQFAEWISGDLHHWKIKGQSDGNCFIGNSCQHVSSVGSDPVTSKLEIN